MREIRYKICLLKMARLVTGVSRSWSKMPKRSTLVFHRHPNPNPQNHIGPRYKSRFLHMRLASMLRVEGIYCWYAKSRHLSGFARNGKSACRSLHFASQRQGRDAAVEMTGLGGENVQAYCGRRLRLRRMDSSLVWVASVTGTMGRRRVSEQRSRRARTALMGAGLGSMKWACMRAK
jgi:hypothetical protein